VPSILEAAKEEAPEKRRRLAGVVLGVGVLVIC
jgi:hypothetical protein